MKRLSTIIYIITLILFFSSCSDWLDIQPKTEVKEDKMFENEAGFKDALIGAYMIMGDSTIYGRELTYTFLEVLAQQYEISSKQHPYYYDHLYDYSEQNVERRISTIWGKMYRVIANLNAILENLEKKKEIIHPTHYANIKAEALGLRAFLHFDLLRMFGWGDLANNPGNLDKLSLPYVTQYSKVMTDQSTVKQVLAYIHQDLAEAERLLSYYGYYNQVAQDENYELPNDDGFYSNRRSRFNYYAARATQARVYMWEGKYAEALERASFFTKNSNPPVGWVNLDRSVINAEEKDQDLSFTAEHIFNLDIQRMYVPLKRFTKEYKIEHEGSVSVSYNNDYFYHSGSRAKELFEITSGGGNDQRFLALYNPVDNAHYLFLKFREVTSTDNPSINKMPLIKKPEMYYYVAECYNRLGQPGRAVEFLNEVRTARGIDHLYNLPASLSIEEVDQEILKEWQKEYIGEGQLFYYYKRLNLGIPNASASGDGVFRLPLPKQEVEIGGREDYRNQN